MTSDMSASAEPTGLGGSKELEPVKPSPPLRGAIPSAEDSLLDYDRAHLLEALREAVYAVRNAAGNSEWHRRFSTRPFDHEDFRVWAEHWQLMHPVVTLIAAIQDRDAVTRRVA